MNVSGWNGFDWALAAMVAVSMAMGFKSGIIRTFFGVLGLVVGLMVASANYSIAADWLEQWMAPGPTAQIAGFLLMAGAIGLVFGAIGRTAQKAAHAVGMGFLDRLAGAIFGAARGVLFGMAAILAATAFMSQAGWIAGSKLSVYFLAAAHEVSFVVPYELQEQISKRARESQEETPGG